MDWIHLAQERDRWHSLVNKVTNIRVQYDFGGISSKAEHLFSSGSRTVLHEVNWKRV